MKTLLVLLGPTGVGKTELALQLARHYDAPILNADSRQIYREIPIGTAAPTPQQLAQARHYFVGTLPLEATYSAAQYEADALRLIDAAPDGAHLILSGGSMLYIDALCHGLDDIPTIRPEVRQAVRQEYEAHGLQPLVAELQERDPQYYEIVDRQNTQRVLHAIEICRQTGHTFTALRTGQRRTRPFRIVKIALNRPRAELFERINLRTHQMLQAGWEEEARSVYEKRALPALQTIGYRELFAYFDGALTLPEAIQKIQKGTRVYAKKQLTWWQRDPEIHWISASSQPFEQALSVIDEQAPAQ